MIAMMNRIVYGIKTYIVLTNVFLLFVVDVMTKKKGKERKEKESMNHF